MIALAKTFCRSTPLPSPLTRPCGRSGFPAWPMPAGERPARRNRRAVWQFRPGRRLLDGKCTFPELCELDLERLRTAWQEAVFALCLAEEKIEP